MILNKFLSISEMEVVKSYYNLSLVELNSCYKEGRLFIFESKEHIFKWIVLSNEDSINELIDNFLDIKLEKLREPNVENILDIYLNGNKNICIASKDRILYLKNK